MAASSVSHRPALAAPGGAALVRWLSSDAGVRDRIVTDGRHTVSYAEMAGLLERLDGDLVRRGVTRSHPVALECSQSVAGALAILLLLSREQDVVLLPELGEASKEAGTPRFIPSFCSHVVTARASRAGADGGSPVEAVEVAANAAFAAEPAVAALRGPDLYLRTSGSTGVPKLARMSHQKWLNNAMACVERWRLTAGDRLAVPVPIFHSYGFGAAFLPGLLAGASMDLGGGGNILRYLEREERFAPDVAFLTPALCETFVAVRKAPRLYRLAVTAGDRIKGETTAAFEPRFGPLLNLYGSAEMGAVAAPAPEDPPEARMATAGYPLAGIELRVVADGEVDGEAAPAAAAAGLAGAAAMADEPAAAERSGRLQCRQENGFAGYLIQEGRWRFAARGDDEWFDTGDLARIRAGGYLEILGRGGLSVKRDGLLVVFADVEAAVEKVRGVERAILVAAGEGRRGSRLVAVCVAGRAAEGLRPEAVRRRCRELLPRYAVPDEVLIVESLPRLPSGKIDRRAVRDLAAASAGGG
jgi:acyl-CoA synthetase (AMP-forming)/AMP-acid ligase II